MKYVIYLFVELLLSTSFVGKLFLALLILVNAPFVGMPYLLPYEVVSVEEGEGGEI